MCSPTSLSPEGAASSSRADPGGGGPAAPAWPAGNSKEVWAKNIKAAIAT
jgi:hypothetical protein